MPRSKLLEIIAGLPPTASWANAARTTAICEDVSRSRMRFVPIKSIDQQGQLMVHRARVALPLALFKNNPRQDPLSRWARALAERRGYWRAVVAIAAKNARMCWAMLQRGEGFKMPV